MPYRWREKPRHHMVIVPDVPPEVDAAIDREHNSYAPKPPKARKLTPCGTSRAYNRHLEKGEPIDFACREARNAYKRARHNAKKEAA